MIRGGCMSCRWPNHALCQSIYLQSSNNPIPELKLVVLTTEDQLVFAPTPGSAPKLTVKPN